MTWDWLTDSAVILFQVYAKLGGAALMYWFARDSILQQKPRIYERSHKVVFVVRVVCIAAFIGYSIGSDLGTHVENYDPETGTGDVVVDFEATAKQQWDHGFNAFCWVFICATAGGFRAMRRMTELRTRVGEDHNCPTCGAYASYWRHSSSGESGG